MEWAGTRARAREKGDGPKQNDTLEQTSRDINNTLAPALDGQELVPTYDQSPPSRRTNLTRRIFFELVASSPQTPDILSFAAGPSRASS